MAAYQNALKRLVSVVDGVERQAVPWPDWSITTVIDTRATWETVWRAVCCHTSQMTIFARLKNLPPELHQALWGAQTFYRVFTVNGGRRTETESARGAPAADANSNPRGRDASSPRSQSPNCRRW